MRNGRKLVGLFPDSGHHLYFLPLAVSEGEVTEAAQRYSSENELPAFEASAMSTLASLCKGAPEWVPAQGEGLHWLRSKFGTKREVTGFAQELSVYGVWCAIETNTGLRSNGYTTDTDRYPSQNDRGWNVAKQGVVTPYIATKPSALDYAKPMIIDIDLVFDLSKKIGASVGEFSLEIRWQVDGGDPVPVSLVVDFGNTRTIALGLEKAKRIALSNLREVFRPIIFRRDLDDAGVNDGSSKSNELIPDSWIILREPTFSAQQFLPDASSWPDYVTKKMTSKKSFFFNTARKNRSLEKLVKIINRMPFMFVDLSPAVIGPEATDLLAGSDVFGGHLSFLSSPKRYAWDDNAVGKEGESVWYMLPRTGVGTTRQLAGEIFRFLPRSAEWRQLLVSNDEPLSPTEWDDESLKPTSKPSPPNFPRADALIWSALAIIERASRQIQSEGWRSKSPVRRYLDSVTVTFPPGWTNEELLAYWKSWFLAKEIYNWSRGSRPVNLSLDLRLDEAVASQLSIVFSEIKRFGGQAENWIRAFGKLRNGKSTVRVLTIDIGGGTTDSAVVEYSSGSVGSDRVRLVTEVLFSDSTANAGDRLVKDLIEKLLLPTLGERFRGDPTRRASFENFFSSSSATREGEDRLRRMVITRSVFVPIIYKWLEDISNGREGNPASGAKWDPLECGANYSQIEKLNESFRSAGLAEESLLQVSEPFDVNYTTINEVIAHWCRPLAMLHAGYLDVFDGDLVIVTGKPSELPNVRDAFEKILPKKSDRIIFAKDYDAGDWFPSSKGGLIPDAKMVTVVGAALYSAIKNRMLDGWEIEHKVASQARNFWGVITSPGTALQPEDLILRPHESAAELLLPLGSILGRARFIENEAEPVYVLRPRPESRVSGSSVSVRIKRVTTDAHGGLLRNEHLRLESCSGRDQQNNPITIDDIELKLSTLAGEVHWLDQGSFAVKWN